MGKPVNIQQNLVVVGAGEAVASGYVGFLAKSDGLYQRRSGHPDERLLIEGDVAGDGGIIIPKLSLKGFNHKAASESFRVRDYLLAKWQSANTEFLSHSPEIWLFRRNSYRKSQKRLPLATGTELMVNGGFSSPSDWTIDPNANNTSSISDGVLHVKIASPGGQVASSDTTFTTGKYYRVRFTVSNYVSGELSCYLSGYSLSTLRANGNGTRTGYIYTYPGSGGDLTFSAGDYSGAAEMDVDDVSVMELTGEFYSTINKKWKHESHLNGVKFPNSKYYSGVSKSPVDYVTQNGRHTEWELTAGNDQYQEIDINPYEFCRHGDINGDILTDDVLINDGIENLAFSKTKKWLEIRFAIVINNPDTSSDNPKLIGPLSDIILMRPMYWYTDGLVRRWRIIYSVRNSFV